MEQQSGAEKLIDDVLRQRFVAGDISNQDRAELLHCVLYTDAATIAETILQINSIKMAVKNSILMDIEKSASQKCVRSDNSYLFQKDYPNLKEFDFHKLVAEIATCQPFLLESLLAVSIPISRVGSIKLIQDLIPRLGLVYSLLMSFRFHELSRLQRVLTVVLLDECVHEKVIIFSVFSCLLVPISLKSSLFKFSVTCCIPFCNSPCLHLTDSASVIH